MRGVCKNQWKELFGVYHYFVEFNWMVGALHVACRSAGTVRILTHSPCNGEVPSAGLSVLGQRVMSLLISIVLTQAGMNSKP